QLEGRLEGRSMVVTDDRRQRLERLRDQLTKAIESCGENMLPQLAGQLRATLDDLAALPVVEEKVSLTDELKQRRAARRVPAPKAAAPAARAGVKRGS
ncbi:MAG: hypothetical protein ACOYL9_16000, partial [Ilumatobacteraceae bacterium]